MVWSISKEQTIVLLMTESKAMIKKWIEDRASDMTYTTSDAKQTHNHVPSRIAWALSFYGVFYERSTVLKMLSHFCYTRHVTFNVDSIRLF